ncbi:hypothetical protein QUB76_40395, partial [Microcoleus sp. D2B6]
FHPILPFFVYPLDNLHFFLTCHKWFLTKSLPKYCNIFNQAFRAGETPTPQENLLFVEQARCLFLTEMQDVK